MARKYLKDNDGLQMITSSSNRTRAFQVAETISLELDLEAVITNVRDPESGGMGLGIYLHANIGEIPPETIEQAIDLWNEYI